MEKKLIPNYFKPNYRPRPANIDDYAALAYEMSRSKGFWDTPNQKLDLLLLIQSELFEGLDAIRKDNIQPTNEILGFCVEKLDLVLDREKGNKRMSAKFRKTDFKAYFETHIKNCFADEMADFILRLLVYASATHMATQMFMNASTKDADFKIEHYNCVISNLNTAICTLYNNKMPVTGEIFGDLISYMERFCYFNNIDIWTFVHLKLEYNKTRPHMFGKKF